VVLSVSIYYFRRVPPNISPSGCPYHRSQEKALGDVARKIASTVVVMQTSSGMIGAVSLSLFPASLPGPLALPPSFPIQSFSWHL